MVYSNFDSRAKGARAIPDERLRFLRQLEEKLRGERRSRKKGAISPAVSSLG